jgi:hypothetical protein
MAITIPVTHAAKQKNSRRSPKSTGIVHASAIPCAKAILNTQAIAIPRMESVPSHGGSGAPAPWGYVAVAVTGTKRV